MLLGNLLQALYNTIDSIWVGRFLGPNALAAVAVSFPIIFALIALVLGLTMATTTLVAQNYGAKRMEEVKRVIGNSALILTLFALIISIVGILGRRTLLQWINVPPDVIGLASDYLGVFLAGLVPMFLYNVVGAILRGLGDSKTPLKFLAYATCLNILLDPLLIFGLGPIPALGVSGAALATVISQSFSAIVALRYLSKTTGLLDLSKGLRTFDWDLTKLTIRIGLPAGLQQMFVSLSGLVVASIVNRFGSVVMAGFGVGQKLDQFAFLPAMSLGIAVTALVGQNLGANKEERVKEIVRVSVLLGVCLTGLVSLVAFFLPHVLIRLFTQDAAVLLVGTSYLRIVAFSYIAFAIMFTMGGVLRGAGDTLPTMLVTVLALWIVRVPLAFYLSGIESLGEKGAAYAILVSPIVGALSYFAYYKTGRWKRVAVLKNQNAPAKA